MTACTGLLKSSSQYDCRERLNELLGKSRPDPLKSRPKWRR